jgi:hypothetical protein
MVGEKRWKHWPVTGFNLVYRWIGGFRNTVPQHGRGEAADLIMAGNRSAVVKPWMIKRE